MENIVGKGEKLVSNIFSFSHNVFQKKPSSESFNSLPNNKILDWSKLKAYADDKINVTEKLKFVMGKVENFVGKGENAGYQHFLLFLQCFQKAS